MRLSKLAADIAKQLHRFHQVEIPGSKKPQLWIDVFKFYEKASTLKFDDIEKQRMYETISFKEVHNEVVELKASEEELEAFYVEANSYMLASHLYWALWALIQARMSPINFDYLSHFFLRYNEYKERKATSFSLAQAYLLKSGSRRNS